MRRYGIFLIALVFIWGCGQQDSAKEQRRQPKVEMQKNYLTEAMQHLKEADAASAIQSFDEAIKQDPLNPKGYLLLGQVYMHMKDYSRAIDTFAASVRVAPDQGDGYYYLAMCHGLIGEKGFAIKNAQRSVELFRRTQDDEKFMKSLALLQGLMQPQSPPGKAEE